jgi:hypothetical protein
LIKTVVLPSLERCYREYASIRGNLNRTRRHQSAHKDTKASFNLNGMPKRRRYVANDDEETNDDAVGPERREANTTYLVVNRWIIG